MDVDLSVRGIVGKGIFKGIGYQFIKDQAYGYCPVNVQFHPFSVYGDVDIVATLSEYGLNAVY